MKRLGMAAFGWLVPGGGYLILHRRGQFAAFAVAVCVAFAAGLAMQGGCAWPGPADLNGVDGLTALTFRAGALARMLAGGPYLAARLLGLGGDFAGSRLHEYGATLLAMAGVTNLLALSNALRAAKEGQR
jgi:hypothetical protein